MSLKTLQRYSKKQMARPILRTLSYFFILNLVKNNQHPVAILPIGTPWRQGAEWSRFAPLASVGAKKRKNIVQALGLPQKKH